MFTSLTPHHDNIFSPMLRELDRFYDEFFNSGPLSRVKGNNASFPKVNATYDEGKFLLTFAVPGMGPSDLEVQINKDNVLTLKGCLSENYQSSKNATYYIRELRQSSFERSLRLPEYVRGDPETLLKDGILELKWNVETTKAAEDVRKIPLTVETPALENKSSGSHSKK